MVEITPVQRPPGRDHVALVDPEPDGRAKGQADRGGARDQPENRRKPMVQAATSFCSCSPNPSIPSFIVCPTFRKIGFGFFPSPTPGGVPVAMMSPAFSVMK